MLNSPAQIYNVDETGIPIDLKAPNVVTKTRTKKVQYRSTGRKGQITVVSCVSDAGQVLPPTVLFIAKKASHAWTSGEIPRCSDKGWINTDLFESWVSDHFIKHAVGARPL